MTLPIFRLFSHLSSSSSPLACVRYRAPQLPQSSVGSSALTSKFLSRFALDEVVTDLLLENSGHWALYENVTNKYSPGNAPMTFVGWLRSFPAWTYYLTVCLLGRAAASCDLFSWCLWTTDCARRLVGVPPFLFPFLGT